MKNRNTITQEQINAIIARTNFRVNTVFDKTTLVAAQLPNGFVIVEASSCVDPDNYDEKLGVEICKKRIVNKIWELEGYKLQDDLYRKSKERPIEEITINELVEAGYSVGVDLPSYISPDAKQTVRITVDGRR